MQIFFRLYVDMKIEIETDIRSKIHSYTTLMIDETKRASPHANACNFAKQSYMLKR